MPGVPGGLLFAACVDVKPAGVAVPGSDRVERGWPHTLPGVERGDHETAYLIRTDASVKRLYEQWLYGGWRA